MPRRDEVVFVLHGLDVDAKSVRADVFAQKLQEFIQGLREADRFVNNARAHDYLITEMSAGSAHVTIRERQRTRRRPQYSSITTFEQTTSAVYNGDRAVTRFPENLVKRVGKLTNGVLSTFSHAELVFSDENVIRIDDFLARQSEAANQILLAGPEGLPDRYYRGLAIGRFDGELQEIDNRGLMLRGKLILAPGIEIDCIMNKERILEARDAFGKRVLIEGTAHYDGEQQLPARIDVLTIRSAVDRPNLLRWRGAFNPPVEIEAEDDEWC